MKSMTIKNYCLSKNETLTMAHTAHSRDRCANAKKTQTISKSNI